MGFVDALQAIWDTGDAAAPLDPRLPLVARNAMLDALRPTRIVRSDGEQHALADGIAVEEGDALVVATSGTSGQPKGVVLTHDAIAASAHATSARLGIDPSRHSWLACLPLAHIGGLSVVTRSIVTATPLVVMPGFEAKAVEEAGRSGQRLARRARHDRVAETRSLGLQLRSPRWQQSTRRAASQRGVHLRHDRDGLGCRLRRIATRRGGDLGAIGGRGVPLCGGRGHGGGRDPAPGTHALSLLPRWGRRACRRNRRRCRLVRHRRRRSPDGRRDARRVRPHR